MQQRFLDIFEQAFHKLNLVGVKLLKKSKNKHNRTIYKFVGKFQFVQPLSFKISDKEEMILQKEQILNFLHSIQDQKSNCITHKFTRKIRINGSVQKKVTFNYVFDVNPKTIIDFGFEGQKMVLYVIGWGI